MPRRAGVRNEPRRNRRSAAASACVARRNRPAPGGPALRRLILSPEGHVPFQPFQLLFLGRALALQKLRHGAAESRIGDEMRRPGCNRAIAPRKLVPALRTRLDASQAARYRDVDRTIIAKLEMQIRDIGETAPI